MHRRSRVLLAILTCLSLPAGAFAQSSASDPGPPAESPAAAVAQESVVPRPAQEYSDGYHLRAKIHRISSFATLPLFATEAVVGQSLYNNPTDTKRNAHLAVAGGIGALFAVNTVTGVWNLLEARKDPNGRKRRLLHGVLMLGADAGFLATAALGPSSEHEGGYASVEGSPSAHRAMAFTSISLATTGYLIMLFGGH
jgi:hypothetical protein